MIILNCIEIGVIGGFLGELFSVSSEIVPIKFKWIFDCLSVLILLIVYPFIASFYRFGDFRFYFFVFSLIGYLFYRKSFHRMLAFLMRKMYNSTKRKVK